jgi:hypothetical protein
MEDSTTVTTGYGFKSTAALVRGVAQTRVTVSITVEEPEQVAAPAFGGQEHQVVEGLMPWHGCVTGPRNVYDLFPQFLGDCSIELPDGWSGIIALDDDGTFVGKTPRPPPRP